MMQEGAFCLRKWTSNLAEAFQFISICENECEIADQRPNRIISGFVKMSYHSQRPLEAKVHLENKKKI